jgi:rod shape determining protein RodA
VSVKELVGSRSFDYLIFSLYLSMLGIGLLMIYSVGYNKAGHDQELTMVLTHTPFGKQLVSICVSFFVMFLILSIDHKFWRTFAYLVYGLGLIMLMLVLVFGNKINGARAWFIFGGFGFQPAEIAKIGTCLALSSFLSSPNVVLNDTKSQQTILGIIGLPVMLILLQPDFGSTLVFVSFYIMLFREGISANWFFVGALLAAVFIMTLKLQEDVNVVTMGLLTIGSLIFAFNISYLKQIWISVVCLIVLGCTYAYYSGHPLPSLAVMAAMTIAFLVIHSRRGRFKVVFFTGMAVFITCAEVYGTNLIFKRLAHHQQDRLNVWLRPDKCDPRGVAYNLIHSKMAIGSGGLQGKGFLEGAMTKLNMVPEQQTDFIFCTIGEEQGFIGVLGILVIFVLFLVRIVQIAERQKSNFSRNYAYGVAGIFFFHFFINIGMTMGLIPVVGIPLPFISAGGSSLLGFTCLLAILLKLDSHRYSL